MTTAEQLIARLELVRLPREGGWVRELGECAGRGASSILYLATRSCVTSWHRLGVEEYWCHHSGDNIRSVVCNNNNNNSNSNNNIIIRLQLVAEDTGTLTRVRLGSVLGNTEEVQQCRVPRHTWFKADLEVQC